jgi:hypothetical protein
MSYRGIVFGLATIVVSACGTDKETDNMAEAEAYVQDTTKVTVDDTTKFKFDFALANIPSPATSIQELQSLDVAYDASILNDTRNTSRYTSEYQRAMNLGIYNIDMAYAMMNNKGQDVLQYMKTIMIMSEALGLKNAVGGMVGKRAESNLQKQDSLFKILDEIFVKSDSYLRTNDRLYTAAIIFAGSWLESLYLNCKISAMATSDRAKSKAHRVLWEQRFHLGNLTKVLQDYRSRPEDEELLRKLTVILDDLMQIKQTSDMSEEKFNTISNNIFELRKQVVS